MGLVVRCSMVLFICCFGHLFPGLYIVPWCLRDSVNGVGRGVGRLCPGDLLGSWKVKAPFVWLTVQTSEVVIWGVNAFIPSGWWGSGVACERKDAEKRKKEKKRNNFPSFPESIPWGQTVQEGKERWLWIILTYNVQIDIWRSVWLTSITYLSRGKSPCTLSKIFNQRSHCTLSVSSCLCWSFVAAGALWRA